MNIFKYITSIIFLFILTVFANSQDKIDIYFGPYPADSISVCKGDTVDFYAAGTTTVINSNFDNDNMGKGWSSYSTHTFSNPCIPHPNGSTYLWFNNSTVAPREIVTKNFNTSGGGIILFDLIFAIQFGANPCEGPDVDHEGVSLQYSNDGGLTWGDIIYFCPDGNFYQSNPMVPNTYTSGNTSFTYWNTYSYPIPSVAQTSSTKFRWIQFFSSTYYDNWGMDNIEIVLNINDVYWKHGETDLDPPSVNPYITTMYEVNALSHYTGSNDTIALDEVKIKVYKPINIDVDTATICNGDQITLNVINGCQEYFWSTGGTNSWITVMPDKDSIFSVILTDVYGCVNTDSSYIFVQYPPIIDIENDTMCIGDTDILMASGGIDYLWSTGDTTPYLLHTADTSDLFVTVYSSNGCKSTRKVIINPLPTVTISSDTIVCYGKHVDLFATGGDMYFWSSGNTEQNLVVRPITDTTFNVIVIDSNKCINYDTVDILVNPYHELFVSALDDTICRSKRTFLESSGAYEYLWNTGEDDSIIRVQPDYDTWYLVTGSVTYKGLTCDIIEKIKVTVIDCNTCFVPNAFSPKGINNIFKPKADFQGISDYSFMIFDRMGTVLFETNNYNIGWDGKIKGEYAPIGVYVYKIQYINKIRDEFRVVGSVTLMR